MAGRGAPAAAYARLALIFLLGVGLGFMLSRIGLDPQAHPTAPPKALQARIDMLKHALADAEARLQLQQETNRAQQQALHALQRELQGTQQRLDMLEDILRTRRKPGVHILHAQAQWQQDALQLHLVIVKGGNYPRTIEGDIAIFATHDESSIAIPFDTGRQTLPYRLKNHMILDERIPWTMPWRPDHITVVLRDQRGKERARVPLNLAAAESPVHKEADE